MTSFKRSNVKLFEKKKTYSPESHYWKKFSDPILVKEFGPVDYLHFSPVNSGEFAVTSSARVQVYNTVTKLPVKNLNKFKETAYGGSFRQDGKLICAGSEDSVVRIFDVSSRQLLRRLKGHKSAVHRTYFTCDKVRVASFSDDKTVALWDISTEQQVAQFQEHNDYIRAGCVSPVNPNLILSGGYDGLIKMYDARDEAVVCSLDHGSPIESALFLPSGSVFITAGGKEVRIWDAFTRTMLARCSQYHKTVTSMSLYMNGRRLLTGSLDHRIKVIDLISYKVSHSMSYTSPILSIAASTDDRNLVTGTVSGLITIQKRGEETAKKPVKRSIPFRYVSDTSAVSSGRINMFVTPAKRDKLAKFEFALRKFEYSKALDCVMVQQVAFKTPATAVTLFDELIRRKGLSHAVRDRNSKQLSVLLRFLLRYICVEVFTKVLVEVADCVIDSYCDVIDSYSSEVKKLFENLLAAVRRDISLTEELVKLQGFLEMIFVTANSTSAPAIEQKSIPNGIVAREE